MSPTQIVAVAIRLFIVWQVVITVISIPALYAQARSLYSVGWELPMLFYLVAAAIIGVLLYVLWRFPMTVAGKILSRTIEESEESASPDLWLSMGCALMGLWLLVVAIPEVASDVMAAREGYLSAPSIVKVRLAADVPALILGIWLIFGAKGFRKLFWWARGVGIDQSHK